MIQHLSGDARKKLKELLPGMLNMLAGDNLEIFLQTEQSTVTNNGKLVSLTTATSIPMQPDIKKEDLRYCEKLWMESLINQNRSTDARSYPCLTIHSCG
jgi:hypothetical protein